MSTFSDLVNIEEFDKRDYFSQERWEVSFYCKDCKKIVETNRPDPNWYKFICNICSWTNIAIWTQEGLKSNYKIKE
jgi:Zn finger protein HypA/HybF involved in hydrogenase expression